MKTKEIIQKLKEQGMTKWRISKLIGVHWNTVNAWDKGVFEASDKNLLALKILLS